MSAFLERRRERKRREQLPEKLEQAARELRPIWHEHTRVSPWFDVGMFRVFDPRSAYSRTDVISCDYDHWVNRAQRLKQHDAAIREERSVFNAYTRRYGKTEIDRVLDLHIPPRAETRTIISDVPSSIAQLAGWVEAFNCYHPEAPIRFIMGRTSLPIHKRAKQFGFDVVLPDRPPTSVTRSDILEHLVQNEHLTAKELINHPYVMALTKKRSLSRAHGISRIHGQKYALRTDSGRTLILPNPGNGWKLWLTGEAGGDDLSDREAQVLRGAIQVAAAYAHDSGHDIRIRIPSTDTFAPFLDKASRTDGIWTLWRRMGTPVISYGYPPRELIKHHLE